jgi:NAD(P)-dependent dehydrogenase (short-subunit alcohol dehydrogenase family)
MTGTLQGEIALITGGSRGIGLAIAHEGGSVVLVARSEAQLTVAAQTIKGSRGTIATYVADVTDESAMSRVIESVRESLGPITILVNNAGSLGPLGPFGESTHDDWWRCVEVNVRGSALCAQLVLHDMTAMGRGRIINIVSGGAAMSSTYFSAYSASKAAVVRWIECIASELQTYGVRVFAMEPGTVATAMTDISVNSPNGRRWIPWFKGLFDAGLNSPPERVAQRALDLAAGRADALSGRYIPLVEDLDDMVANAARIRDEALYSLRLNRLQPPPAALEAMRARSESRPPASFASDAGCR